jgi:hypothetical protein
MGTSRLRCGFWTCCPLSQVRDEDAFKASNLKHLDRSTVASVHRIELQRTLVGPGSSDEGIIALAAESTGSATSWAGMAPSDIGSIIAVAKQLQSIEEFISEVQVESSID